MRARSFVRRRSAWTGLVVAGLVTTVIVLAVASAHHSRWRGRLRTAGAPGAATIVDVRTEDLGKGAHQTTVDLQIEGPVTFAASLPVEHAGNYERGTSTNVWYDPANHERLATAWDVARDDTAETLGGVAFSLGMLALVPLWLLRTGLIMAALLHGDGLRETRIAQVRTVQRYKDRYTLARFEGESTPYTMRRGLGNLRAGPAVATGPGYWRLAMSRGGRPYLLRHPRTPGGRRRWISELGPPGRPRHRRARRR